MIPRVRRPWGRALVVVAALYAASPVHAQQTVATTPAERSDADEVFARLVTFRVDNAPLRQAIDQLAARANILIGYRHEVLDSTGRTVTLHVTRQPLGAVLSQLLAGTKLHAVVTAPDVIALRVVEGSAVDLAQGIIGGRITNAKTKQPIAGVTVWLDDSVHAIRTDEHGGYRFVDVPAGTHHIVIRALGFARQVRLVTVLDDRTATVDVALESSVNALDQVVVTATGEQRIRELGHVVSQINADSLVREAPITNVIDLLQSRVPGLQVLTSGGGVAGAPVSLRLRGQSSLNLNSEPIVIVDGVRYKSNNVVPSTDRDFVDARGFGNTEPSNPLADLNVNDIDNVEIVKGPSASTLYGPDGANGVIVITTKRGKAGKTEWHWYAHPLSNSVPTTQRLTRTAYHVWAHDPNDPSGAQVNYVCTLQAQYRYHQCVIDSVTTAPTVYQQPDFTTIGKARPTWQYGADVGGGSPILRYYFSGDYTNQIGNVQVPAIVQDLLKQQLGVSSLSDAIRNPSALQTLGTHGTVTASPSSRADVTGSIDYHQTSQRLYTPSLALAPGSAVSLPPGATGMLDDSLTESWILSNFYNANLAMQTQETQSQHVTGNLQGTWRLTDWLAGNGLIGIDLDQETEHDVQPGSGIYNDGNAQDFRRNNLGRTFTLNARATNHLGHIGFQSSIGVNYIYSKLDGLNVSSYGIANGTNDVGSGSPYLSPLWAETVSLGTYAQEVFGLSDQLFLDAGLRLDGSTRFGDKYHPAALPKVGLSWIASDAPFLRGRLPGLTDLRFRTSYGSSTRYPTSGMKLGSLYSGRSTLYNQSVPIFDRGLLANTELRPETAREFEYGADATLFSHAQVGLTWWNKRTHDELSFVQWPTGLPPQWRNAASVAQHGFEATITVPLVSNRRIDSDLLFNYSHHTSKVLSLGQNVGSPLATSNIVGYPIDAVFTNAIIDVRDTVGGRADGIYEYGEAVYSPTRFYGVFEPPTTITLTPQIGLFNGSLHLSAAFDRETGFVVMDQLGLYCVATTTCKAAFDSTTPLLEQAELYSTAGGNPYFLHRGDFTRWRELNLSLSIPTRFLHLDPLHLRFSGATISLQGRNLALWTSYPGSDPESNADPGQYSFGRSGIPQARSWGFRFDITP